MIELEWIYRSSSVTSLERSGSLRRRSFTKENVKATEPAAPQPDKNKLIEVEKAEMGKVGIIFFRLLLEIKRIDLSYDADRYLTLN